MFEVPAWLSTVKIWPAPAPLVILVTALVGVVAAEEDEAGAAPEQGAIKDAMDRGRPEGMTPEVRQAGRSAGRASRPPGKRLVGRAMVVEARRAAEKANDFILSKE